VAVSVGAIMRREWCDPFETSMSDLGVTTVWLGEHLDAPRPQSLTDLSGLVVELSREVMGSPATEMLFELPVAGVPVAPESASIAQSLGIRTILWGEDEARAWLTELEGGRKSAPAPLLAVWGSAGAPGATSLAIGLSHELAKSRPVVLLDADFVAPSVSELLGLPGDHSGLLGALRVARNDSPQWESLLGCATPFVVIAGALGNPARRTGPPGSRGNVGSYRDSLGSRRGRGGGYEVCSRHRRAHPGEDCC